MSAAHTVKPGQFFYSSWGYEQTNVDFYKVIAVTAKSVKIQQWSVKATDDRRVIPGDKPYTRTVTDWSQVTATDWDERVRQCREAQTEVPVGVQLKRVQTWSDRPALVLTSYSNAYLWDGASKYDTRIAGEAGH
jgi:hypothetical protein